MRKQRKRPAVDGWMSKTQATVGRNEALTHTPHTTWMDLENAVLGESQPPKATCHVRSQQIHRQSVGSWSLGAEGGGLEGREGPVRGQVFLFR